MKTVQLGGGAPTYDHQFRASPLARGSLFERIDTVVRPQPQIYPVAECQDGPVIGQMGPPRMLVPIAFGLSWRGRLEDVDERCECPRAR